MSEAAAAVAQLSKWRKAFEQKRGRAPTHEDCAAAGMLPLLKMARAKLDQHMQQQARASPAPVGSDASSAEEKARLNNTSPVVPLIASQKPLAAAAIALSGSSQPHPFSPAACPRSGAASPLPSLPTPGTLVKSRAASASAPSLPPPRTPPAATPALAAPPKLLSFAAAGGKSALFAVSPRLLAPKSAPSASGGGWSASAFASSRPRGLALHEEPRQDDGVISALSAGADDVGSIGDHINMVPIDTLAGADGGQEHMFAIHGADLDVVSFIKERPTAEMLSELGEGGKARKIITMDGSNKAEFNADGPRKNFVALNLKNKRLMCFTHQRKRGPTSGGKRAWLPPELFAKQQKHKWIQEVKERRCTDALHVAVACTDGAEDGAGASAVAGVQQQFEQAISEASQRHAALCALSSGQPLPDSGTNGAQPFLKLQRTVPVGTIKVSKRRAGRVSAPAPAVPPSTVPAGGSAPQKSDVFEFDPSDDDAPLVASTRARKRRGAAITEIGSGELQGGKATSLVKASVVISSSSSECDDIVDIDISDGGSCDAGSAEGDDNPDFDDQYEDDMCGTLSADDFEAACAAEFLATESAPNPVVQREPTASSAAATPRSQRAVCPPSAAPLAGAAAVSQRDATCDAEADSLVAQMMDNPEHYRQKISVSAAKAPSASSAAYPPGSELRLRATRPHEDNISILKDVFGFDSFRDKQEDVINLVLSGQSCLCVLLNPASRAAHLRLCVTAALRRYVAPTGCGKSLTFQLPAFKMDGLIVVISPLLVLMHDQVRRLPPETPGCMLASDMTPQHAQTVTEGLRKGEYKILFVSPERFVTSSFVSLLQSVPQVSLVVVDEAHCVTQWAHNFRPAFLEAGARYFAHMPHRPPVLALTATATNVSRVAIAEAFGIPGERVFVGPPLRADMQLGVFKVDGMAGKLGALKDFFCSVGARSKMRGVIVYCLTQADTEAIAEYLMKSGISAKSYHAGCHHDHRRKVAAEFSDGTLHVVVATTAFGMGIDIPSVAAVIMMSPPRTIEEFAQMAGRAGRALGNGTVLLMCSDEDKQCLNAWAYTDYIHEDVVVRLLKWVRRADKKRFGCITDALSKELDIKPESVHTILQLMSLDEELPLTLMGRHPLHIDVKRYLMRSSTASHPVVDKALDMAQSAKGSKGVRLAELCNALAMDPDCVMSVLRVAEAGKMINLRSVDTAIYYQVTCVWSEAVQKHCNDNLVATLRLLQKRVVSRTAAILDLVDDCAKASWTQALVRFKTLFSMIVPHDTAQAHAQKSGEVRERVCAYFEQDHLQGVDTAAPTVETCCKGALWADVLSFTRANHEDVDSEVSIAKIFLGIPTSKYPKYRWVRDPVWGCAKAQDFEALLVMAAEARRKCEEANAQRAPAASKAPKKKRAKAANAEVDGLVKVFDLESAMASAPRQRDKSIDD